MDNTKVEKLFSLMKQYGVSHFKSLEVEIRMEGGPVTPSIQSSLPQDSKNTLSAAAVPPVEMSIPHHMNEVANLLKLDDVALVEKLFPDHSEGMTNANN